MTSFTDLPVEISAECIRPAMNFSLRLVSYLFKEICDRARFERIVVKEETDVSLHRFVLGKDEMVPATVTTAFDGDVMKITCFKGDFAGCCSFEYFNEFATGAEGVKYFKYFTFTSDFQEKASRLNIPVLKFTMIDRENEKTEGVQDQLSNRPARIENMTEGIFFDFDLSRFPGTKLNSFNLSFILFDLDMYWDFPALMIESVDN